MTNMYNRLLLLISNALIVPIVSNDQEIVIVTDDDLIGGETYYWTAENAYVLDGLVTPEAGGLLAESWCSRKTL